MIGLRVVKNASWTWVLLLAFLWTGGGGGGGGGGSVSTGSTGSNSITTGSSDIGSVSLSWSIPTAQEGSRPLADLAGYSLYYGTSPRNYNEAVEVGNLSAGTYYFALTAYDGSGYETDFSEELRVTVP